MIVQFWFSYHQFYLVYLILLVTQVTLNREFLPQFEDPDTETVTVTEGDTAVITCKIGYLNNQ